MRRALFFLSAIFLFSTGFLVRLGYADEIWPYRLYRGNLHVHTILSNKGHGWRNGIQDLDHLAADSPEETVQHARAIGLGVLGFSDHGVALNEESWGDLGDVAERQSTSSLIVLRGFEWTLGGLFAKFNPAKGFIRVTHGNVAHVNVFGSSDFTDTSYDDVNVRQATTPTLDDLYQWVERQSDELLVCQFNHPTYGDNQFNLFRLPENFAAIRDAFCLFEVGSGPTGNYESINATIKWYNMALQKGWRVAPTIGIDNWGSLKKYGARNRHTGIWLEETTPRGVLEALRARRTFASEDENFELRFWAEREGTVYPMGSIIQMNVGENIGLRFRGTEINESLGTIYCVYVYPDRVIKKLWAKPRSSGSGYDVTNQSFTADENIICVYILIEQKDGDRIVGAPIWLEVASSMTELGPVDPDPPAEEWDAFPSAIVPSSTILIPSRTKLNVLAWSWGLQHWGIRLSIGGKKIKEFRFLASVSGAAQDVDFSYSNKEATSVAKFDLEIFEYDWRTERWERARTFKTEKKNNGVTTVTARYHPENSSDFPEVQRLAPLNNLVIHYNFQAIKPVP